MNTMLVSVFCSTTDAVYSLEVETDMELETFRVQVRALVGDESGQMEFFQSDDERYLSGDKKTLTELGVKDNDVLIFKQRLNPYGHGGLMQGASTRAAQSTSRVQNPTSGTGTIDWSTIQIPPPGGQSQTPSVQPPVPTPAPRPHDSEDPESIRQMFLSDQHQLSLLKERNPRLADAIHSTEDFKKVLEEQRQERQQQDFERVRLSATDPFDPEAQAQIAEEIRMENVNLNMQNAMEYNPEAFAEVYMLYINCRVSGHSVKAFVDSGAQMTIMSKACADRCGIMRLIDQRWQGMAVGVGKQKIIGRVHMGQMQIEDVFLSTSFTILENQPMDILLGLDMLKRHQCCIDLKKNSLVIGTTGTETTFLSESELPECARLNRKRTLPQDDSTSMSSDLQEEEDRILAEALLKSQAEASS